MTIVWLWRTVSITLPGGRGSLSKCLMSRIEYRKRHYQSWNIPLAWGISRMRLRKKYEEQWGRYAMARQDERKKLQLSCWRMEERWPSIGSQRSIVQRDSCAWEVDVGGQRALRQSFISYVYSISLPYSNCLIFCWWKCCLHTVSDNFYVIWNNFCTMKISLNYRTAGTYLQVHWGNRAAMRFATICAWG